MGDERPGEVRERTPRERQRRRRRRRHLIGWIVFLLVAGGILYAAYATFGSSDSSDGTKAIGTTTVPTTTTIAPAGPFKTTAGVNVRSGPATTQPIITTLDLGTEVMVVCAVQGEAVSTPGGPQTIWVKITAGAKTGYVSAVYVDIGQVLADPTKIGDCPAT